MHRTDNTKFLLFIEPTLSEKSVEPITDKYSRMMWLALSKAKTGTSNYSAIAQEPIFREGDGWRGTHTTECGQRSSNSDFLLENGMVTNSLAAFYLEFYRNSIPDVEMKKVYELAKFYNVI